MKKITLDELQDYTVISVSDEKDLTLRMGIKGDDDVIKAMVNYILAHDCEECF